MTTSNEEQAVSCEDGPNGKSGEQKHKRSLVRLPRVYADGCVADIDLMSSIDSIRWYSLRVAVHTAGGADVIGIRLSLSRVSVYCPPVTSSFAVAIHASS